MEASQQYDLETSMAILENIVSEQFDLPETENDSREHNPIQRATAAMNT